MEAALVVPSLIPSLAARRTEQHWGERLAQASACHNP